MKTEAVKTDSGSTRMQLYVNERSIIRAFEVFNIRLQFDGRGVSFLGQEQYCIANTIEVLALACLLVLALICLRLINVEYVFLESSQKQAPLYDRLLY